MSIQTQVLLQYPGTLKQLNRIFRGAINLGIQDTLRTLKARVMDRTPVGWKYKAGRKTKANKRYKGAQGKGRLVKSGYLKGQWQTENTGNGWILRNDTPYAYVLEEGRYKGVGPRTVATSGGIFSRQAPGGIIKPIFDDDKIIDRVVDVIIFEIERLITQENYIK